MISQHQRAHLNHALLAAAILAMTSGLVLFTQFHVGPGAHATVFAGVSKCAWRNVHSVAGILFALLLTYHLYLHAGVLKRLFTRVPRRWRQLLLLVLSCAVCLTGLAAWIALPHGVPALAHARHACIDVHNITGLLLLAGTVQHIRRRWHAFSRRRPGDRRQTDVNSASG